MAYLAHAGFDAFSMDMTGYGRSTRPAPMNDPCNVSHEQQAGFIPALIPAPCSPSYPHPLTTIASDWNDLGCGDRLLAFAASCRKGEPGGMVAGRSASRRLHGAASGTNQSVSVACSRL